MKDMAISKSSLVDTTKRWVVNKCCVGDVTTKLTIIVVRVVNSFVMRRTEEISLFF